MLDHARQGSETDCGARVERNDYTGNEFLPNRGSPGSLPPIHLLWTAASRTVRAPSRFDRDPFVPGNPPFLLAGAPTFAPRSQKFMSWGTRTARDVDLVLRDRISCDYDHLRTQDVAPSGTFLVSATGWKADQRRRMWGKLSGVARLGMSAG